ncbi:hypothetical protein L6452_13880 [Arctium lappa]|uniref:Uncharacterized protein n=1 Tax=Arctium lappa TaxID=4217 RepID=A0ACB9CJV5_ARCLA|nr:hypothetical protein L6452_13880 [Arctium lappa]
MDSEYEIAGKCIQGVGMDRIDDCRSSDVDVVGNNPDLAISEEVSVMFASTSSSKDVVLAFDSLQCSTVEVVDGVSKPVDVYRVDGCFVPDVYRVDGCNVDYDSVVRFWIRTIYEPRIGLHELIYTFEVSLCRYGLGTRIDMDFSYVS